MRVQTLIPILLLSACATAVDKGPESALVEDVTIKPDTQQKPFDHGELDFDAPLVDRLTAQHGYHAWEVTIYGAATLTMTTAAPGAHGAEVDTVVYLYREGATGWGHYVGRNDDANGNTVWSKLTRPVTAGRYRVLVKGYDATDLGKFALTVGCVGDGCHEPVPEVDTSSCLFGTTFNDLRAPRTDLQIVGQEKLYASTPLTSLGAAQVVLAVQQSSHTDVTTVAEAFAAVDEGEINRLYVWDAAARRSFVAYEYGAGDNSYGGIFHKESTELAASIHDGDLYQCTVLADTCLLGEGYHELLADPAFAAVSSRRVTAANQLSGIEAAEALAAVQRIHPEVADLAQAIAAADDATLNLTGLVHTATHTEFLAIELGAGDTSVGAVYFAGTLRAAALIEDGGFDACGFFAARGGAQAGADCRVASDCGEGLACQGVVAGFGKCEPATAPTGAGATCASDADCASGQLVCAGFSSGSGVCRAAWSRTTFGEVVDVAIPDAGTLTRQVTAYGLAARATDVELRATILHDHGSQVRVTLTDTAGHEIQVYDGAGRDDSDPYVVVEGAFPALAAGAANGVWTLRVVDGATGAQGKLIRWDLTVTSR
jgi:hypothetical protein